MPLTRRMVIVMIQGLSTDRQKLGPGGIFCYQSPGSRRFFSAWLPVGSNLNASKHTECEVPPACFAGLVLKPRRKKKRKRTTWRALVVKRRGVQRGALLRRPFRSCSAAVPHNPRSCSAAVPQLFRTTPPPPGCRVCLYCFY